MKKLIYSVLLILLSQGIAAQTLGDFNWLGNTYEGENYLDLSLSRTTVTNKAAPHPEAHRLNSFTGSLSIHKVDFGLGSNQTLYQHKLLFDLFLIVENQVNGDGSAFYRDVSSGLTTGMIGWVSTTWNIVSTDRTCVALGGNLNDYFIGTTYSVDTAQKDWVSLEPQGYWFAGGPSLMTDVLISNSFVLHAHGAYSMGYWRAVSLSYAQEDNDYPNPHFGSLHFHLQSRWGAFVACDYNWIINRGDLPNDTKRLDALFGFRFRL